MQNSIIDLENQVKLRERALSRLTRDQVQAASRASASQAMGVLHELAASPDTAADALALLHELQVHQVELELQDEELRKSRAEMEARLGRHARLYEFSPVASFTIDRAKLIADVNGAAVRLLGHRREQINGKCIDDYLRPEGIRVLDDLLFAGISDGESTFIALSLLTADGKSMAVRAVVSADPAGGGAMMAIFNTM